MWVVRPLLALLCAVIFSAPSLAAMVNATQGQVLVNQGTGYQQVAGSADVKSGSTIVVNPGGSAQIVYPDGCSVSVQPGSVYTVSPQSPCLAQGGSSQETGGINGTTLAIGAVVVGGGAAALLLLNNNKDKSASP